MTNLDEMEVGLPDCPSCGHATIRGKRDASKYADGEIPILCANCGEVGIHVHHKLLNHLYSKDAIDLANGR